jgi:hypothetical protein
MKRIVLLLALVAIGCDEPSEITPENARVIRDDRVDPCTRTYLGADWAAVCATERLVKAVEAKRDCLCVRFDAGHP